MQARPDLIVCDECDAIHQRPVLAHAEIARCLRCDAELARDTGHHVQRLLPLTVAGLILFMVANTFPIMRIEMQGLTSQTTLAGAALELYSEGMTLVAVLVSATTIFFPLVQMLALLYLLLPVAHGVQRPGTKPVLRLMQMLRPWGMVEVFLLGVLVALVKLSNIAEVTPGIALWAFGALTILLTMVTSLNPRYLWQATAAQRQLPGSTQ